MIMITAEKTGEVMPKGSKKKAHISAIQTSTLLPPLILLSSASSASTATPASARGVKRPRGEFEQADSPRKGTGHSPKGRKKQKKSRRDHDDDQDDEDDEGDQDVDVE